MATGNAIVGALRAVLGLDTAAFEEGSTKAQRESKKLQRQLKKTGDKIEKIGDRMSLGITAPVVALGFASVRTATDMEELESAFDVVFGNASDEVRAWAETTGNEMGRATSEIQEGALAFQQLFEKALDPKASVALSKQFAVLTQDLASFKNLANEDAQRTLFSGLTGEAEPLRKVGVFLNAAAVETKALEMGMERVNGKFTDQQKIVARAALIQEQLADANGDVIRTFDSQANQVKRAQAAFTELQIAIGTKLLPTVTPLITKAADLIDMFANLPDPIQNTVLGGLAISAAFGPVLSIFGRFIGVAPALVASLVSITGAGTGVAAVLGTILAPMLGVTAAVIAAVAAWKTFSPVLKDNKKAREELYGLIEESEASRKKEKATTLENAAAHLTEANAIRERIRARLEEERELLKKQSKALSTGMGMRSMPMIGAVGDIMTRKAAKEMGETAEAIRETENELAALDKRIEEVKVTYVDLGGVIEENTDKTEDNTGATAESIKEKEKLEKSHKKTIKAARDEIRETKALTEALSESEREYQLVKIELDQLASGFMGSREELRALAEEILASREAFQAVRDDADEAAEAEKKRADEIRERREKEKQALQDALEDHDQLTKTVQQEIEENRLLAEALAISTREYEIQREVLRLLEEGHLGTKESVRAMAEQLVASREKLEEVGEATKEREDDLEKFGSTGMAAFDSVANSVNGLLNALQSGDWAGILGSIGGLLSEVFGDKGDSFGSKIGGIFKAFGGMRASGGPVLAGVPYRVGEMGAEMFVPSQAGRIVPANQMNSGGGEVKLYVDPSPYFDTRVDSRSAKVAHKVAPIHSEKSVGEAQRRAKRTSDRRLGR